MTLTAENNPSNLVDSGLWQPSGAKWEFWRSAELPPPELCSAIALVAIMNLERNEVVLTRNQRGWETIAGGVGQNVPAAGLYALLFCRDGLPSSASYGRRNFRLRHILHG